MGERRTGSDNMKFELTIEETLPKKFAREMREIADRMDKDGEEICHIDADELICDLLKHLGFEDGVKVFEDMPKWYA